MRIRMQPFYAIACLLMTLAVGGAASAQNPWRAMAVRDLIAIRDRLSDSHPAPAEPNRAFLTHLNEGFAQARKDAASATSYFDYKRAVRRYVNGFRDGHIALTFVLKAPTSWPGFAVAHGSDGTVFVTRAEAGSGVSEGDRLLSCDGEEVERLLRTRVDPYYTNPAIPHSRNGSVWRLFLAGYGDERLGRCRFETAKGAADVRLKWRRASPDLIERLPSSHGAAPEFGLKKIDGVWFASVPTFMLATPEQTAEITALIEAISNRATELRSAVVVLDVRGNSGGNSRWGDRIVDALWGEGWAEYVASRFDSRTDWRVSKANIDALRRYAGLAEQAGQPDAAASQRRLAGEMAAALAEGKPFLHKGAAPTPMSSPPPNPMTGRIFLLTDSRCFSACLDFADIVRRIPGTIHIGLPTSADTIYMENANFLLPSGLARFGYPMKAYRHRVRASNEWYEPQFRWTGGEMTFQALAQWIKELPRRASDGVPETGGPRGRPD